MAGYTLKELVRRDKQAVFQFYRDGQLFYKVEATDFVFPVPISDIGNATFLNRDRAPLFMRYIRKHLETLDRARNGDNS